MNSVPLWISSIARPLSLSSVMEERVHSLRRRRAEKERSQETLPTGVVRKITKILCSAGKVCGLQLESAEVAVFGLS